MFRSVQWRIAVPFILLIVVSMGILGIYLTSFARNSQLDNLRSRLESEARIIAEASLPAFLGQGGDLDALAKKLGEEFDAASPSSHLMAKCWVISMKTPQVWRIMPQTLR